MAREILNNLDTFGIQRGKLNANFLELWTVKLEENDVLIKSNNAPFSPVNPYNPATKQYVDNAQASVSSIYDPTGQYKDVFERSNHYGSMGAQYVVQDSDYRFVSDAEKAVWNAKEDAIGTKRSGFNLDLGTTTGTLAEGDHVHTVYEPANAAIMAHVNVVAGNPHGTTAADLGLDQVDNTSDLDKPISTAVQTALDSKVDTGAEVATPVSAASDLGTTPTAADINSAIPSPVNYHQYFLTDTASHAFMVLYDGTNWYYNSVIQAL